MYENLTNYELLKDFKSNIGIIREQIFEEFFLRFTPLLEKYAWKLGEKDIKYFLAEALYNALLIMPDKCDNFKEDKYIVNYIYKSIKSEYIKLSKYSRKHDINDEFDDSINSNYQSNEIEYHLLLITIESILNQKELELFKMRFINNYSQIEIARKYNISRQAINKKINKIRRLLFDVLLEEGFNTKKWMVQYKDWEQNAVCEINSTAWFDTVRR